MSGLHQRQAKIKYNNSFRCCTPYSSLRPRSTISDWHLELQILIIQVSSKYYLEASTYFFRISDVVLVRYVVNSS